MKLIIDISEETYKARQHWVANPKRMVDEVDIAIANGTPLPEGHGRIIDESQVTGTFIWDIGYIECYAPTIIEADKEESEG